MITKPKKKIFIDCGTQRGQGLSYFAEKYRFDETWDIYLFEPNPYLFNPIKEQIIDRYPHFNMTFFPLAVSHLDNQNVIFRISKELGEDGGRVPTGGASTLVNPELLNDNELSGYIAANVQTIKLSKFLADIAQPYLVQIPGAPKGHGVLHRDVVEIILKLDVEGAEYDILEDMIETSAGCALSEIWIEFHNKRFKKDMRETEIRLVGELFQMGVGVHPHW